MNNVIHAFADESADQEQKSVFCVAALFTCDSIWKLLEKAWMKRLHGDDVCYFRTASCKSVRGPFEHLRKKYGSFEAAKKVADKIHADLEDILLAERRWGGIMLGLEIPDYQAVMQERPEAKLFYAQNPTLAAYEQVMYEVALSVQQHAEGFQVTYVIDNSHYSAKIQHALEAIKKNHPTVGRVILTCVPLDDEETPALQMADLLANVSKEIVENSILTGGLRRKATKWDGHVDVIVFNREYMIQALDRTLASQQFADRTLARQLTPPHRTSKSELKKLRRALWKRPSRK